VGECDPIDRILRKFALVWEISPKIEQRPHSFEFPKLTLTFLVFLPFEKIIGLLAFYEVAST
jgi:hypothetical protein